MMIFRPTWDRRPSCIVDVERGAGAEGARYAQSEESPGSGEAGGFVQTDTDRRPQEEGSSASDQVCNVTRLNVVFAQRHHHH